MLKKFTETSKELVLKIDIESTARLAKLKVLKSAVAKILGLKSVSLRLVDVTDGCVVVTFLIPTLVAEIVFNKYVVLADEQVEKFKAQSVLWL